MLYTSTSARFARALLLEIEHDRALVAVGVEKDVPHAGMAERPGVAHHVAAGRLDLDHVGAEVGEDLRRVRAHHHRGEVEHAHAVQRAAHVSICISSNAYESVLPCGSRPSEVVTPVSSARSQTNCSACRFGTSKRRTAPCTMCPRCRFTASAVT